MKIALYIRHEGLMRLLFDLWEDHDVRIDEAWTGYDGMKPPVLQGDEDIIVSTIPHMELNWLQSKKPVIAYVTDPIHPTARPGFDYWQKQANFIAIGAENCYPPEFTVPVSNYIPYAVKNYSIYNGKINKVLVVNRKPDHRLEEITRGAFGEAYDVARLLGDMPYTIAHEFNRAKFKQMYADYKVLFYFSNSPFTIVMYEAMTVGMPIVAYNHCIGWWTSVIEKYFTKRSIHPKEIRQMLQEELDKPIQAVSYPVSTFEDIKTKWNNLFNEVTNA